LMILSVETGDDIDSCFSKKSKPFSWIYCLRNSGRVRIATTIVSKTPSEPFPIWTIQRQIAIFPYISRYLPWG
jgi:hypothetical protein